MGARTGEEYLKGLRRTDRELWLGDERVDDVTHASRPWPAPPRLWPMSSTASTSSPTSA